MAVTLNENYQVSRVSYTSSLVVLVLLARSAYGASTSIPSIRAVQYMLGDRSAKATLGPITSSALLWFNSNSSLQLLRMAFSLSATWTMEGLSSPLMLKQCLASSATCCSSSSVPTRSLRSCPTCPEPCSPSLPAGNMKPDRCLPWYPRSRSPSSL